MWNRLKKWLFGGPLLLLVACTSGTDETVSQAGSPESWERLPSMPTPRSEMPAANLNEAIYVPGGFGGLDVLERYEPTSQSWQAFDTLPEGRHHLMAAGYRGKLYLFGGARSLSDWAPTASAWVYDPVERRWAELAPMPEKRLAGAAVVLDEYIYIVGGRGGSSALLRFDPQANSWAKRASLSLPREHTAAVALNQKIYVMAGRWEDEGELASVEVYDPDADAWFKGSSLHEARAGHAVAVLQGRIIVLGGEIISSTRKTLASVEIFDPTENRWRYGPALPVPVHGAAAVSLDQRIYLIGGSDVAAAIENEGRLMALASENLFDGKAP